MPSSQRPSKLKGKDIPSLAKYIKSGKCNNGIVLMLGAGVSTSAGIPDFRSPKTGLYANLARLKLPYPEAVFEINYFRKNPVPFYTLANELYPGKFRPTITHAFIRLLASHSLLHTCFTQNIDTLERRAGVPANKIIEAHGSFASQRCIDCERPYDDAKMKEHILSGTIAKCEECDGLVKPDIVFFGEALPKEFLRAIPAVGEADLLIVLGTSLTVHPFASLADMAESWCPRVLINLDRVGDFGKRPDDVVLQGKCDDIVIKLCKELGWEDELIRLWEETKDSVEAPNPDEIAERNEHQEDERIQQEVEKLTNDIGRSLKLDEVITQRLTDKQATASSDLDRVEPSSDSKDTRESPSAEGEPKSGDDKHVEAASVDTAGSVQEVESEQSSSSKDSGGTIADENLEEILQIPGGKL